MPPWRSIASSRTQHYGRGAYDFGEETLLSAARRLGSARPELAIPLADLNLEFFPQVGEHARGEGHRAEPDATTRARSRR